jgi:hypothetical protein
MPRAYFNLEGGAGQRYYYNLESAPGGIRNSEPALITLFGRNGAIQELNEVFRTPATLTILVNSPLPTIRVQFTPDPVTISLLGRTGAIVFAATIVNSLVVDYSTPQETLATILTQMTVQPSQATITIVYPSVNLTQGGDIRTITPTTGLITLGQLAPNFPSPSGLGLITVSGLIPGMHTEITLVPETGLITVLGLTSIASAPFAWIEDSPAPLPIWLDDPRA